MKKYRLKNGITVIHDARKSDSVAVEVMFKVGSNFEKPKDYGISHYLEHMLFEGTRKRGSSREIANEIEKFGGDFNAYTTGDRTAFYIRIINKRFENALEILADMIKNSVFDAKMMEKEKDVVLKEINMVMDDSRLYQWVIFQENLFEKHPVKNPTYGNAKSVKAFTRSQLFEFYRKYYTPNNMIVSIVGNASDVKEELEKHFGSLKPGKIFQRDSVNEPAQDKIKVFVKKKKTLNSYMVLGYKSVPRTHKDSYVFDVITGILGRGQSGWMFDEIRNKRGLAYQVGINSEMESDYGHFAVFTGLEKKNIEKARKIILEQFEKLKNVSGKDVEESKTFVEGSFALQMEENFSKADNLAFWETISSAEDEAHYLSRIKKVTVSDVRRVAKEFFNEKYTLCMITG